MILQLNIVNFALIENLSINFEQGFNVLSGETGAGKSILIDAINYVLGGKFNKSLIRTGEDRTYVEAIFSLDNKKTETILRDLEVECEDLIVISRETFQSGKSIAKVNGKTLLLAKVKQVSETLLDIHGQHENQNLLDNSNHISYVDSFGADNINDELLEYQVNYSTLFEIEKKINELEGNNGQREKNIDYLKYQIDEITNANLKLGEDEVLEESYNILSNSEKLEKNLNNCYNILYHSSDEYNSVFDGLSLVIKELRSIEAYMDKIKAITDSLEESYYNIEENIQDIRTLKSNVYYDEKELEYVNMRMYQISTLKKKYGDTIEDIVNYKNKIEVQYDELINSGEIIQTLKNEKKQLENNMRILAEKLHKKRCDVAKDLEMKIKIELDYIGLEKSTFNIDVEFQEKFVSTGCDKIQFCISTNPGEPLKPLEEIVSGGELSRIMLALKTVFVDKDEIPTVIFDEIDTGISGRIAQCVAEKMYLISRNHQVFCVTHLPQIASMADINYLIAKEVLHNKTFTKIRKMNDDEKHYEVARMIGGTEVTPLTIENSKEMINMAKNKKII